MRKVCNMRQTRNKSEMPKYMCHSIYNIKRFRTNISIELSRFSVTLLIETRALKFNLHFLEVPAMFFQESAENKRETTHLGVSRKATCKQFSRLVFLSRLKRFIR